MASPPNTDTTNSLWGLVTGTMGFLAALGTVTWHGITYFRQKRKDTLDEANWKSNVENLIAELRREIEHRKEMDGLRHKNTEERLVSAEQQLDEVLRLLIQVYQDSSGEVPPTSKPHRR